MGALDIAVVVCVTIALFLGIKKGIISMLMSIAVLIVSVWASMKSSTSVAAWLGGFLGDASPVILKTASFIVIFIAVAIVLRLVTWLIEKCLKLAMLGWVNRICGAVLSVCCCILVLGLVSILFDTLYAHWASAHEEVSGMPAWITESIFYEPIHNVGTWIFPYLNKLSI